ncbi:hypothetical protein [Geodermatophilus sp. CPCC 205506]|uniref:hypothetical protein n=1 Tax=Geodermatophilus sp. CPCC 205506 TaxID=2936596 RepID=UPI003EEF5480
MNEINRWAASLDGAKIPGGCEDCDAFQTLHVIDRGLTRINIHHDDWCPTYRRMRPASGLPDQPAAGGAR